MNGVPFTRTHPDDATLGAYHDGELRGFARAEVEEHLATCPRCRRVLDDLHALDGALRALPLIEPPEGVRDAVLARVAKPRPRRRAGWRPVWAVAAVLALLAALAGALDAVAPHPALSPYQASRLASQPATPPGAHTMAKVPTSRNGGSGQGGTGSQSQGQARGFAPNQPLATQPQPQSPRPGPNSSPRPKMGAGTNQQPPTVDARLIVRDGEIDLRVRDVQAAFNAVGAIAVKQGGYVSDSNNNASTATGGAYAATLTLRVPAAHFQAAMQAIAALPHTRMTQRSNSEDITTSYQNLQAQLQALQVTRGQLMDLMRKARSVRDAMSVLDRLTSVNTQIDAVQGQIMASANSVMLSTITVNLSATPRQGVVAPVKRPHEWQPGRDLTNALSNLRLALQTLVSFVIYVAVYLALPALLAALALLMRRLRLGRGAPRGA